MRGQEVPGPTGGGTPPSFQPWLAAPSFTLPVFLPPPDDGDRGAGERLGSLIAFSFAHSLDGPVKQRSRRWAPRQTKHGWRRDRSMVAWKGMGSRVEAGNDDDLGNVSVLLVLWEGRSRGRRLRADQPLEPG